MKSKLLIGVLTLLCAVATIAATSQQTSKTWEYRFEYGINAKKANDLGAQGWELVAVGAPGSGPASNVSEYVFKRQR